MIHHSVRGLDIDAAATAPWRALQRVALHQHIRGGRVPDIHSAALCGVSCSQAPNGVAPDGCPAHIGPRPAGALPLGCSDTGAPLPGKRR